MRRQEGAGPALDARPGGSGAQDGPDGDASSGKARIRRAVGFCAALALSLFLIVGPYGWWMWLAAAAGLVCIIVLDDLGWVSLRAWRDEAEAG